MLLHPTTSGLGCQKESTSVCLLPDFAAQSGYKPGGNSCWDPMGTLRRRLIFGSLLVEED